MSHEAAPADEAAIPAEAPDTRLLRRILHELKKTNWYLREHLRVLKRVERNSVRLGDERQARMEELYGDLQSDTEADLVQPVEPPQ